MDYLKLFQTHQEYEDFVSGGTMVRPNVSHCINENEVHYNGTEKRLIATFNLLDATQPAFMHFTDTWENIIKVEVTPPSGNIFELTVNDLTLQSSEGSVYTYTFNETGEYTLKYTFVDPTIIKLFEGSDFTSIIIPKCVTTIDEFAFQNCSLLTSIEIPDNVTSIGESAFDTCDNVHIVRIGNGITYIGGAAFYSDGANNREYYIYATTPPEIDNDPFYIYSQSYTIYVPAESVNAYKAASGWSIYANKIQAIPTT